MTEEKNSVKVYCRVRPLNEKEIKDSDHNILDCTDVSVVIPNGENEEKGDKTFSFDRVFSEACTQEQVFNAVALPSVNDIFRGYNCTIFAYGMTSSGKTFTMNYVISNLMRKIFDRISKLTENIHLTISMSYIEI